MTDNDLYREAKPLLTQIWQQDTANKCSISNTIANVFLTTVRVWPSTNPPVLWYGLVYPSFFDAVMNPRLQTCRSPIDSWRRSAGWALEEVYLRHYGPFLKEHGVLFDRLSKKELAPLFGHNLAVDLDKIDLVFRRTSGEFLGAAHVKSQLAERRTGDTRLSQQLLSAGYISPFLTLDGKSTPGTTECHGEYGSAEGNRNQKRRDVEEDRMFSGAFAFNSNTKPTLQPTAPDQCIYVCNFSDPDDYFSRYVLYKTSLLS